MNAPSRIAVDEREAARLMTLKRPDFLRLVALGILPSPRRFPSEKPGEFIERWHIADLEAIMSGETAKPNQDFE